MTARSSRYLRVLLGENGLGQLAPTFLLAHAYARARNSEKFLKYQKDFWRDGPPIWRDVRSELRDRVLSIRILSSVTEGALRNFGGIEACLSRLIICDVAASFFPFVQRTTQIDCPKNSRCHRGYCQSPRIHHAHPKENCGPAG